MLGCITLLSAMISLSSAFVNNSGRRDHRQHCGCSCSKIEVIRVGRIVFFETRTSRTRVKHGGRCEWTAWEHWQPGRERFKLEHLDMGYNRPLLKRQYGIVPELHGTFTGCRYK